jgi:deoxyinosine 3'endonuclease (endonuclease V)
MNIKIDHSWNLTEPEAILLQQELATKVIKNDQFNKIHLVAGVDVAYQKRSKRFSGFGHRIALTTACSWILKLSQKYRLPETIRRADHSVKAAMKKESILRT